MKILVTGGAGLIGSNVVEELNNRGESNIVIVDHLGKSEKWKNLSRLNFIDYFEKDFFLKKIEQGNALDDITRVIHLGACSSTTETDSSYLIQNNFEYTKILALECVKRGVKFVYASSAATYGGGEQGYDDYSELEKLRPLNMYGYSKHLFDLFAKKSGLSEKIAGLKYFNVFGFGEDHKGDMRSLVLKGYKQILENKEITLFKSYKNEYADGEQKRDFLYVKDAAKITLHILFNNHTGIFNVGRGIAESWNDLATALFVAMEIPVNIRYIEMPQSLREKYQYYTKAETNKLGEIGYKEKFFSLEESVKDYVHLLKKSG